MSRNPHRTTTATAGRDLYFGSLPALRELHGLHAEAETRRLIAEQRRLRPRSGLRRGMATVLRRTADRLAPAPTEIRSSADRRARTVVGQASPVR